MFLIELVEEINSHLSQLSVTPARNSSKTRSSHSFVKARAHTLSRLLAVLLQTIQITANITHAMLQSIREREDVGAPHSENPSFVFSLVQKSAPIVNELLPLFVNLCTEIVQSWDQAQIIQTEYLSLRELQDVQEKAGSRPGTSSSHRSEGAELSQVVPRNDLVWFEVDQSFLLSVLVEATVLMGTIMSLPSVYANISNTGSSLSASIADDMPVQSSYTMNTVAPVVLNVLTMSDRW